MPLRPTTRTQVDGHRFLLRRARHAVVSGDVRMLHDPLRRQSLALAGGIAVAAVVLAGCAILALLRPAPDLDRSEIMVGADSGALYVRIGSTVHPVTDLASARLALGHPAAVVVVGESELRATARGPLIGIPGAPSTLPTTGAQPGRATVWTVCDHTEAAVSETAPARTVVGVGAPEPDGPGVRPTAGDQVVVGTYAGTGWLLREGTRARLDLHDAALLEALGLAGATARPVSAALLDTLVDVGQVARPRIERAGEPVGYDLPGVRIGQVVSVATTGAVVTYVALDDGLAQVGPVVADLIRSTRTVGEVLAVSPDRIAGTPRSTALDVAALPSAVPRVLDVDDAPVVCAHWSSGDDSSGPGSGLAAGTREPFGRSPVDTARSDGAGPAVDAVLVPGGGLLVQAVGERSDGVVSAARTVLTDTGVRYDVPDQATAEALGLPTTPAPGPAGLLETLARGPVLERGAALVQHDGMGADPQPGGRTGG